jgi:hypothetical protein
MCCCRRKPEKRLRRAELEMDDVAYAGRKVQRKDVEAFAHSSGDDSAGEDDETNEEGIDNSSGSDADEDGDNSDISADKDSVGGMEGKSGGLRRKLGMLGAAFDGYESEGGSSLDSLEGVPPAEAFAVAGEGNEEDAGAAITRLCPHA